MTPDRRRAITAVVWKDLRVAMASKSVVLPLAIVPLIFIVVLPVALALLAPSAATDAGRDLIRQLEDFSPTHIHVGRKTLPMTGQAARFAVSA